MWTKIMNSIEYLHIKFDRETIEKARKDCIFAVGKSYTTSSCRIPQGGNAARVYGRSGAM